MSNQVQVKDVIKNFDQVRAVDGVSLEIEQGQFFSLLGPSGCGKTTLLRLIAGFEVPNSGDILIDSKSMDGVDPNLRPTNMVFQNYAIFPHLNVEQNVAYGLRKKKLTNSERASMINQALDLVGLSGLNERSSNALSGGQKQRVALARALILKPKVLLLDEPFSNLDSNIKTKIREETSRIIKESGITTIFVTHDIADTFNISDRILIFKAGVLQQFDEPVKMYCNPVNCYCAKVLGDLNQININNKTYYIRPENIYITKESSYKAKVLKSQFVGKEYKIAATVNDYSWHFFHNQPLKNDSDIYLDFNKKDLLEFDSCLLYTSPSPRDRTRSRMPSSA